MSSAHNPMRNGTLYLAASLILAGCLIVGSVRAAEPPAGPPPPPPHIMRAQMDGGYRLQSQMEGQAIFSNRCGACHFEWGMGTNLITKQQLAMGNPPTMGLLVNREDLTADYVKAVVRMGKNAMPRQTRVDITDAELAKVAAYLGKGK